MTLTKADWRRLALDRRDALTELQRAEASAAICRRVLDHEEYHRAGLLFLYAAMRSEVDPGAVAARALADGKRLGFPLVDWNRMAIVPVEIGDFERVVPGRRGVPQPAEGDWTPLDPAEVDLVLVPGVAFDPDGRRLGYGAGMYDRLLASLPDRSAAWGLAFEAQMVDELPADKHDRRVDAVVTERRWLSRERERE